MDDKDLYSTRELLLAEMTLLQQQGIPEWALVSLREAVAGRPSEQLNEEEFWPVLESLVPTETLREAEPQILADIHKVCPPQSLLPRPAHLQEPQFLYERIHGGVLGRSAGMMLGKPLEGTWSAAGIRDYLRLANAYPLRDYVPLLDPFPEGFELPFWSRWQDTTLGNICRVVQDDDIEYMLAATLILEAHGLQFTTADVGRFWLQNFAYERVFTAERIVYRHLVNGVPAGAAAAIRNPYREWIGAQIRTDVYGYVRPGRPREAAALAYRDAALSHTGIGVYGGMWVAAMIAAAFVLDDPRAVVEAGLNEIPPDSRLAGAIRGVMGRVEQGESWEETLAWIQETVGRQYAADIGLNWVHTIPNACLVALGLLHGGRDAADFSAAIGIAVMGGWDTDCNGATVGSILGVMRGGSRLPSRWIEPLNDEGESYIPGLATFSLSGLSERITRLATGK